MRRTYIRNLPGRSRTTIYSSSTGHVPTRRYITNTHEFHTPAAVSSYSDTTGSGSGGYYIPRFNDYPSFVSFHEYDRHQNFSREAKTDEEKEVLKVLGVDYHIAENSVAHHTSEYEITEEQRDMITGRKTPPQLVIRRGQPFDITLKFDRPFDKVKDDIKLIFDCGENPKESKGTKVVMMLSDVDRPKRWGAKIEKEEGANLTIRIFTPPKCIVAKWNFRLDTVVKKGEEQKVFRYNHDDHIYMIFNPWCPDDVVYMDDEISRNEYVMHDRGQVYRGTKKSIHPKPWNFGQFEDFMLDCVFHLLDKSGLNMVVRGNAVAVVRKISAIVNSADDNGVLTGNWSGDYSGGTSPLAWCGSVAILEQYWRSLHPVNFGQCWVFSAVVVTVCRCLGIPCRSITNFASAHDHDGSITIDDYWTPDGQPLEHMNEDSVWNFHVWNEVWMARPDLPPGYGGWQAIDATPQETSDGVYCCGPSSLEALKNGLVHLPYDGPFIFAEVNADRIHWIQMPDGQYKPVKETNSVGKNISTKSPYNKERMDVTNMYKYPEGTSQERTAVWRAAQEGSSRQDIYTSDIQDMKFDLHEKEQVLLGNPFNVTISINNSSTEQRTCKVSLTARIVFYTGVAADKIKTENYTVTAPAKAAGEVTMTVKPEEYMNRLVDMCQIKISCMCQVLETKQFHCESDVFRLIKPDLALKAPDEGTVGEEFEVEISFTNPMDKKLTACEFQLEGPGLQRMLKLKHKPIGPKAEGKVTTKVRPRRAGNREIIAGFDSKELSDLSGTHAIKINPCQTTV